MTDTTVRVFQSTDSGAPALSGTAGTLIAVLDACLQNGYGEVTIDSLVVASNVATVTDSTGHGFTMIGNVGPVVRISGATPAGLNGDWRITVTSVTQFTFVTSGISDQTASGTIVCKRAPAGFTKAFSGTNLAAYRSDDVTGTRLYLRVDDTGTTNARVIGYEVLTDINTGTGLFPTTAQISGGLYAYKADSTSHPWKMMSDGRIIYFFCDPVNNSTWAGGLVFGDSDPYMANDAFGCMLIGSIASSNGLPLGLLGNTSGSYLARSYLQTGMSIASARYSHGKTTGIGFGGQPYPAPVDNRIHLWPVECWESTTYARGLMPGLWNPIHNSGTPHELIVNDIPQLPNRTLLAQTTGSASYECVIDVTGPWR